MNTIEQPIAPGRDSRERAAGRPRSSADTVDVVVLLAVILTLLGTAAGIAIAFPLALENASILATASTTSVAQTRRLEPEQPGEQEDEPFVADDVRIEGLMQASAATAARSERPASRNSAINR